MSARGRWVVLLGPDGSGKSSVLARVAGTLAPAFARVEARHFRPGARWGAGVRVEAPHAARPRGAALSAVALAVGVARFRRGVRREVRPLVDAGALVLFDRYWHDLLADPRRYRYGGPAWLARLAARWVPRPDLFIVLDAPPHVLQARKQEVSPADSEAARTAYRALAAALPSAVVVDGTGPVDDVAGRVAALVRGEEADG